jgi:hypothetical protein
MKNMTSPQDRHQEHLQVQIPAVTKRYLDIRSAETREPLRVIVLRALEAYGAPVPIEEIFDRRRGPNK